MSSRRLEPALSERTVAYEGIFIHSLCEQEERELFLLRDARNLNHKKPPLQAKLSGGRFIKVCYP
jgi:hypothetical protein